MKIYASVFVLFAKFTFMTCDSATDVPVKADNMPSGLKIEYMFIPDPEVCEPKSKSGDMLTMHYTGTLQSTGKKFDSR